jgi:hypothetical protein
VNRLALLRMAFLAAAVSVAATACGDDDDSDDGRTGGAGGKGGSAGSGGKGGSAGSTSSGGEGGDTPGTGGTGGTGGTENTGGTGDVGGGGGSDAGGSGGAGGDGPVDDCNPSQGEGGSGGAADECSVNADYCAVGSVPGTASTAWTADLSWYGPLENGNPADHLWIELWDGAGVFNEGLTTLDSYTLTGDDLSWNDCNICIYLTDQYDTGDETWLDTYMITGGTVTLTSVEGNITGTLEDATFVKVYGNGANEGEPTPDGCTSEIDQISFNAAIPQ